MASSPGAAAPYAAAGPVAGPAAATGSWRLAGVVGGDGSPSGRGAWELAVVDGRVTRLRPRPGNLQPGDLEPGGPATGDRASDPGAGRALVCVPLLVNAHDHGRGQGNVYAGIPDGPLEPWIDDLAQPVRRLSQDALVGDAARAMVRSGVGGAVFCVNPQGGDVEGELRAARAAVARVGLRAALVYPFADAAAHRYGRPRDADGWPARAVRDALAAVERLADEDVDPRVEYQLGPVGPQWASELTLRQIAEHSAETGRRVHMHLLESPAQRRWADEVYPEGLLTALDGWGLLTERTWFAHGTHLRDDELALLHERGCGLTLNPSSNLRLGSGIAPVARAARRMRTAGLGLDGLALNDDHDAWTELRLARGLWQAQDHASVSGADILRMATRAGAGALGSAAPSDLAPGRLADFVLVDVTAWSHLLGAPGWSVEDVVAAAVTPRQVVEVWIAGVPVHRAATGSEAPPCEYAVDAGHAAEAADDVEPAHAVEPREVDAP